MRGQFTPSQAFLVNGLARIIGAVKLKGVLGNINAQHTNSHVDLPSKVKVHQTKSSLEDPAGLAAWVGMVHYISTHESQLGNTVDTLIVTTLFSPGGWCLDYPATIAARRSLPRNSLASGAHPCMTGS